MFSCHRKLTEPQPLSIIGNRPETALTRMPKLRPLHGFVFSNEISDSSNLLYRELAESFSDAVVHPAPNIFHGSLENTFDWFKDKQRLHEYISAQASISQSRVVFSSNLLHGFFYGTLANRSGILFADHENIEYMRLRLSISWNEWVDTVKDFVSMLNFSKVKKNEYQKQIESLSKHMQNLRLHIPAGVPPQIPKSDLQQRFGVFAANIWFQWAHFSENTLPIQNLEQPVNPANYIAKSSDVFPDTCSFSLTKTSQLFLETFFHCINGVAKINSQSTRFGIKSFESIFNCNDGLLFKTRHELIAPIFNRDKLAERIVAGCIELAKNGIQASKPKEHEGVRVVVEPRWIESCEIIPLSIHAEQARNTSIFSLSNRSKSIQDVAFSLSVERIGSVKAPQAPLEFFRFAARHHPICLLRTPWESDFSKISTAHLRYMETNNDFDYFLVRICNNSPLLWARSAVSLRSKANNQRRMTCVGICAAPPDETTVP